MDSIKKICYLVLIFLFLIIGSHFHVFAQIGLQMSVSGRFRDINTNTPLPDVEIRIMKFKKNSKTDVSDIYTVTSDKKGFFKIRYLEPGNYMFLIKIPKIGTIGMAGAGYGKFSEFEIQEGKNMFLDIFLGANYAPGYEKKITHGGSKVELKILYYSPFFQKSETQKKNELKSYDNGYESIKNEGLFS